MQTRGFKFRVNGELASLAAAAAAAAAGRVTGKVGRLHRKGRRCQSFQFSRQFMLTQGKLPQHNVSCPFLLHYAKISMSPDVCDQVLTNQAAAMSFLENKQYKDCGEDVR